VFSSGLDSRMDDLVDEFYQPLVQPLGNLVILCAQCEASLVDLVAALQGTDDEWRAQAELKPPNAKDRVLAFVSASGFQGFELTELLQGVEQFWTDRAIRNRYFHDEWFPLLDEGGIPAIRGLPWKKGSEVVFDTPTADEIWALAARFRDLEHLFSHAARVLRR
jgi:hypothetical protein